MTKSDLLKRHFAEWRTKCGDDFFEDGIMCEEEWDKVHTRILFILKEVNVDDEGEPCFSLSDLFKKGFDERRWNKDLQQTWENVCIWAKGILNEKFNTTLATNDEQIDSARALQIIKKCAAMNVKKTRGKASAIEKRIREFANMYGAEILQEIRIIDPTVIICCGTYQYFLSEVFVPLYSSYKVNNLRCIEFNLS